MAEWLRRRTLGSIGNDIWGSRPLDWAWSHEYKQRKVKGDLPPSLKKNFVSSCLHPMFWLSVTITDTFRRPGTKPVNNTATKGLLLNHQKRRVSALWKKRETWLSYLASCGFLWGGNTGVSTLRLRRAQTRLHSNDQPVSYFFAAVFESLNKKRSFKQSWY